LQRFLVFSLVVTLGCGPGSSESPSTAGSSELRPAPKAENKSPQNEPAVPVGPATSILLRDVTKETGIDFQHTDGGSGTRYIVETVTAGLALFDYDSDGDIDIYFLNGAPLKGTKVGEPPTNRLYRNDGNWQFTDVTAAAGVGDLGFGLGVAVGDYNNDKSPDIYVNNFGTNVLYRNNGDGTFTDVTEQSGTAGESTKVGAGACFLDADQDGDLDLYVSNYIDFTYDGHVYNERRGIHVYPGPFHYHPTPDVFYVNNGDGTFRDGSQESGIAAVSGRGMGTVCFDYESDGDTDIIVANDSSENFLFKNDGNGHFTEVGLLAGVAYDYKGETQGSMGVICGDYDNDGQQDFYVTSYQDEFPTLYKNQGAGLFDDVTISSGAGQGSQQHVSWGTGFADFDNDGDRDIFVACGHLYDNVDEFSDSTSYEVRNILLENSGKGTFVNVSNSAGDGMQPKFSSRGCAFDDLDNDGDIDAVIVNSRSAPTILRNDSKTGHHWLQIRLQGADTNRDGIGARVRVVAGDLTLVDEVHSGRGYESHYGTRLHFGLGPRDRIDRIEVHWIGQEAPTVRENVAVDRLITIEEL
jgi:hypothetical protein